MRLTTVILIAMLLAPGGPWAAPAAEHKAPTRLYPTPQVYPLLKLPGELVTVHYTPGSLNRSAELQLHLQEVLRAFGRWADQKPRLSLYMLSRQDWQATRYDLPYGVPLRVGALSLAAPAAGDAGTGQLWTEVIGGLLPRVTDIPYGGTPQAAATLVLADLLVQQLSAEILIDETGLGGDQPWVRGLVTHLAAVDVLRRYDPDRLSDLNAMYGAISRERGPQAMSVRDYHPDLSLRDWLWFQGQFHFGAQVILEQEGKGSLKKMKKLRKQGGGVLRGEELLREYEALNDWFRQSFSAVSMRTDR